MVEEPFEDAVNVKGTIWTDPFAQDGYIRVVDVDEDYFIYCMSPRTYRTLSWHGLGGSVIEEMERRGAGLHLIPGRLLDPEAAEEVERTLEYADPAVGHSDACTIPGCLQDVASTRRGFPLCATHDALMADWDDLAASPAPADAAGNIAG
jgi:hypothetical protein